LNLAGGSTVDFSGTVEKMAISATGGSRFEGFDLEVHSMICNLSGGSEGHSTITEDLVIAASGASTLSYKGDGKIKTQAMSGGSEVKHLAE
jgi:hypothetical protein